jgi:zinc transport system substrate-binding protein
MLGWTPVRATPLLFGSVLLGAGLLLAGCGSGGTGSGGGRKLVVAAFYPLAFAAEQVGGPPVDVRNLTPAGAEPHDRELTTGNVRDVDRADLVLYLGDGFMPSLETAVERRRGPSLDLLPGAQKTGGALGRDPHVWLDPARYAEIARRIGVALGNAPAAARFAQRLDGLDAEYRRGLAQCRRRQVVTSHAAFGYLARRYGLEQVPLQGLSPEAEPSARDIAHLVDLVRQSGATTVFSETLISPKLAQTVAREAGVETALLDPLEGLSESAARDGADYFTVMRANLAALRKALGCTS